MARFVPAALLAIGILGVSVSAASAQAVEKSHGVYHVAACARTHGAGATRCHAHIVTDRSGVPKARSAAPNVTPSGYGPSDLRSAYNVTGSGSSTMVVAIVDAYGYTNAESDLGVYRAQFGLPPCTTANGCFKKVNQKGTTGTYPKQNTGWAQESALDLDMVSAMCPNCKIILVEANTNNLSDLAAAENTAVALGANVVSNSYGGGEAGSSAYEPSYNHAGVAITASSGDSGYSGGTQFPASSPHVTAVGGTSLSRDTSTRGWSETVWSDAGSGCSVVYAKPTWQTDKSCLNRMVADVSAVADPSTGVAVYGPVFGRVSAWLEFGGTSVAAPLIGGIYAVNNAIKGVPPVNYGSNPYAAPGALNDVTSGNNGTSCPYSYYCNAGVGYDGPTGLGTPNGVSGF
jgi:subtilase family serine protease